MIVLHTDEHELGVAINQYILLIHPVESDSKNSMLGLGKVLIRDFLWFKFSLKQNTHFQIKRKGQSTNLKKKTDFDRIIEYRTCSKGPRRKSLT